jgi:prophage antirepressor-like protein
MEQITNKEYGSIRIERVNGQTLYCAYDVCVVLKIENGKSVIESVVGKDDIVSVKLNGADAMFLTTDGLRSLVDFVESVSVYDSLDSFKDWLGISNVKPQPKNEEVVVFENEQFGQIRTAGTSENPLFCLADICKALELTVQNTKKRLNEKGVYSIYTLTQGGEQQLLYVNEQNLYKVIMRSDKPQAEAFQDWVCGEVLPSIRKTGSYAVEKPKEVKMAEALKLADETINEYKSKLDYAKGQIQGKTETIKKLMPLSNYAEKVLCSDNTYTLTEIANELGFRNIGIFTSLLKANKIIYKGGDRYMTYADITGRDYFTTRTANVKIKDKIVPRTYLVVTEKGREYLHERFDKNLNFGLFKDVNA